MAQGDDAQKSFTQKSVREVAPGDILAEDVVDENGKVVLAKGAALAPSQTSMLIDLRVFTVKVSTEAPKDEQGLARSADLGEVDRMFKPHLSNPLMAALHKAARAHHAARVKAEDGQ